MSKFVDLSKLFSSEKIETIEKYEKEKSAITDVVVRGLSMKYFTNNKRLLWIAGGLEYIEPELLDFIDSLDSGSVFYDVGASNGPFSIYAARKGLRVVAIEPEAQNFALLEMNHYLNNDKIQFPINSLNVALSDKTQLGKLYCAAYEGGGHMKIVDQPLKVLETNSFPPVHVQTVQKYSLDTLLEMFNLPRPNSIKIDVDGSEMKMLNGAHATFKFLGLTKVFIEIANPETEGAECIGWLNDHGFFLKKKTQVQHYEGLYNCIFMRK